MSYFLWELLPMTLLFMSTQVNHFEYLVQITKILKQRHFQHGGLFFLTKFNINIACCPSACFQLQNLSFWVPVVGFSFKTQTVPGPLLLNGGGKM